MFSANPDDAFPAPRLSPADGINYLVTHFPGNQAKQVGGLDGNPKIARLVADHIGTMGSRAEERPPGRQSAASFHRSNDG